MDIIEWLSLILGRGTVFAPTPKGGRGDSEDFHDFGAGEVFLFLCFGCGNRLVSDYVCCYALGENGRDYFHRISRFYPGYTEKEADDKYDKCLRAHGTGQKTVRRQLFMDALPDEFDRHIFIEISSRLNILLSTA